MMKTLKKISLSVLMFAVITGWLFSGWPQFRNFPPKIQKAYAATNDSTIEVLGGGGGGGVVSGKAGGGGGGGEYRQCTETLSVQSYTVTVGTGGTENTTGETDSSFAGTGISMTADGGNGTNGTAAGTAGTGGVSTGCDTAVANYDGGTPGVGVSQDFGGGGGGGAGYGGKGGNGADAVSTAGGGGGEGGSETAAGGNASGVTAGSGGGGGDGGNSTTGDANGSPGSDGITATYHIVGGGGGGGSGAATNRAGGACGAPGAGSGGGEATGAGNGCRGEVRIIYVDSEVNATGGTETTSGIYRIHTFTASGTFQVTSITATNPPTVSTQSAQVTGATTAILNGTIDTTGSTNVTERGFAWGTSLTLTGGDTATSSETLGQPFSAGPFTGTTMQFSCNTTYYSRAYATNSNGTGFGGISASFATPTCVPSRIMRLFQGYRIKLISGRLIINKAP